MMEVMLGFPSVYPSKPCFWVSLESLLYGAVLLQRLRLSGQSGRVEEPYYAATRSENVRNTISEDCCSIWLLAEQRQQMQGSGPSGSFPTKLEFWAPPQPLPQTATWRKLMSLSTKAAGMAATTGRISACGVAYCSPRPR